jgi:hypothetical protein
VCFSVLKIKYFDVLNTKMEMKIIPIPVKNNLFLKY